MSSQREHAQLIRIYIECDALEIFILVSPEWAYEDVRMFLTVRLMVIEPLIHEIMRGLQALAIHEEFGKALT